MLNTFVHTMLTAFHQTTIYVTLLPRQGVVVLGGHDLMVHLASCQGIIFEWTEHLRGKVIIKFLWEKLVPSFLKSPG